MKSEYDLGQEDEEKIKTLTKERAMGYMQKIRGFTQEILQSLTTVDPASGRRIMM